MLQEHARRAKQLEEFYQPVFENVARNESMRRAIQNAVRLQAEHQRTFQALQAPAIRRSLEGVVRTLNSPGFQRQLETIRRTMERAQNRLGPEALGAAEYIAPAYFESSPDFEAGVNRAVEKIQDGQTEEVLSEAAPLAASPEILETIEQADKDTLLEAAEGRASDDITPSEEFLGPEGIRAGIDVETVIASIEFSEEERQAILYYGCQPVRFLIVVTSVIVVAGSATFGVGEVLVVLGGLAALLGLMEAARDRDA